MARIPDGVIERLKTEVSVQRLAEARGVVLSKHGADLHGRCPFHDDRTPSLVITPAKNLWHCLGACQAGGTAIDWVMKAEGVSFGRCHEWKATRLLQPPRQTLLSHAGLTGQLDRTDGAFSDEALDHFLLKGNGVRSGHGVTTRLLEEGDNSTKRRQLP